jgi:hypothetical protein
MKDGCILSLLCTIESMYTRLSITPSLVPIQTELREIADPYLLFLTCDLSIRSLSYTDWTSRIGAESSRTVGMPTREESTNIHHERVSGISGEGYH